MNTTKKLQAVLFDVDGTLADTEQDGHRIAFNAAFKQYDLDWNWDVDLYGIFCRLPAEKSEFVTISRNMFPRFSIKVIWPNGLQVCTNPKPSISNR